MFNLVSDDESILHPKGDVNQSYYTYMYNDQEVGEADIDVCTTP